jgi:ribosomal protein L2
MISSFQFLPFKNKLVSLVFFSNGAVTYFLTSEYQRMFAYIMFNTRKKIRFLKIRSTHMFLFQIKKLSFVCFLELFPGLGVQYCRSSGVKAKLFKTDRKAYTTLLQLPSKVKKIFSCHTFAFLGKIALESNKKYINTKSGY